MTPRFDIAVLGAGCFGSALVSKLIAFGYTGRVVLIDEREDFSQTQRWCAWLPKNASVPPGCTEVWDQFYFRGEEPHFVKRPLHKWKYVHINAPDYFAETRSSWAEQGNVVEMLGQRVLSVRQASSNNTWQIRTQSGDPVEAVHIIDSRAEVTRPGKAPFRDTAGWWQSFLGFEVEQSCAELGKQSFCLMDFQTGTSQPLAFGYLLPLGPARTLVEYTVFADRALSIAEMESGLKTYQKRIGVEGSVLAREHGWLPMEANPKQQPFADPGKNYWTAGIRGGCARPSSGYAFLRIQAQADAMARSFVGGKVPPCSFLPQNRITHWLDGVFLETVTRDQALAQKVFPNLLKHTRGDDLAAFMAEKPTLKSLLKVIAALPKWPFVKGFFRLIRKRLPQPSKAVLVSGQ